MISYEQAQAIASALVLANMNSLPFDWAARFSVGGVNMNFFIVKQLPVLPPEAYLERIPRVNAVSSTYAEMIVPRVLELVYTSDDMKGFATASVWWYIRSISQECLTKCGSTIFLR